MDKKHHIFLIEDNDGDAEILSESISDGIAIQRSIGGQDAINKLNSLEENPDLIFLDLNLPEINGRTLLKMLRRSEKTSFVPIIVISTSNLDDDIFYCYSNGANAYIIKPLGFADFEHKVKSIENFWLKGICNLPSKNRK